MRILAIGDIHGCLTSLEALANYAQFRQGDTIVTLGDYVDRGPNSKGVIEFLFRLGERCHLVPLRGNHEVMMLEAWQTPSYLMSWLGVGGEATLASYGTSFEDVPEAHWEFLKNTLAYHETESHFFVHANANPSLPLDTQSEETLYWQRFGKPRPHQSGKIMVCGHTPQRSGEPQNLEHAVCIDTLAYGGGWLTCLDVQTGYYWQTNEQGQRRSAAI